jgi:Gas vesicle synthesis protein GvpO
MADQKRTRNSPTGPRSGDGQGRRSSRSNGSGGRKLSARDAIKRVRQQLPELIGKPVEAILGVERDDDDQWQVTAQAVELARIPNSTDVLGVYAVSLDDDGELAGYRRVRRYSRSQADED